MVIIKKSIGKAIEKLVDGGQLWGELRLTAVCGALAAIEESEALEILSELEADATNVEDPISWVKEKAFEKYNADWYCNACGLSMFASRDECRKCGLARGEEGSGGGKSKGKKGNRSIDWTCPSCGDNNFGRNQSCRKCDTPRPADGSADNTDGGDGKGKGKGKGAKREDWICPECGDNQFARNDFCRQCGATRPEAESGGDSSDGGSGQQAWKKQRSWI
mmetsp:Transcript_81515/g.127196  ORF Transcript_81515/g.127196 Transcript_81515/m.127196 type:complete len:220 (-) Transcript_81515:166-825(-)